MQALFLTLPTEKTKTQAENSSQKLKEKTQPQGGTLFILRKIQEKNSILPIFLLKLKFFIGCHFFAIFMNKKFQILPISNYFLPKILKVL